MGHSWSYSVCDRHSMCPLRLCVTPNFLDKLPNLGTEVYWQMACFLWLRVFVDTLHRHTSHNFPDSTELTSNQSETPYTYYSFELTSIPYIQLHIISLWARALTEISAIFWGRIGKNRFLAFFCHIEFTRTYVRRMYCEISVRAKWREPRNKVHPEE
jgi:hypothetical protein